MRWPWRPHTTPTPDPALSEDRFRRDYFGEFGRLHRVVASSGIIITRLNMGMFHQGAFRFATLEAQRRHEVPADLDALERRLRRQACDAFDHWHSS